MKIGIVTGGGDCPGLNAVIRAVAKTAANCDWKTLSLVLKAMFKLKEKRHSYTCERAFNYGRTGRAQNLNSQRSGSDTLPGAERRRFYTVFNKMVSAMSDHFIRRRFLVPALWLALVLGCVET
jgi:hypothetical protein